MESEISTAETGLELPLAEPHFDDEATVLSARPVVPLDEVEPFAERKPARLTRGWVFAATVVGAMLLGVVVGVGYYSYTNHQQSQPPVGDEGIVAGVEGMATQTADKSGAVVSAPEVSATSEPEAAFTKPPALSQPVISAGENRKPAARRVDVITWPSSREERKAARRLAKQQRKQMEREGRDRNLTRIREIFEGPQRP
jgi:hypothetical protein